MLKKRIPIKRKKRALIKRKKRAFTGRKVNKTYRLDPDFIDEAKRVLGYSTNTETIEETLKEAVNNKKHSLLLKKFHGQFKSYRSLYD